MRFSIKTENINFELLKTEAGWIYYRISTEEQVFENHFTEVWDVFPDFKRWLEAIVNGVQQTSFEYDNEGSDIKFDFQRRMFDDGWLIITVDNNPNPFIRVFTDKKQLVSAFYNTVIEFQKSERYKPEEWEDNDTIVSYNGSRLSKFKSEIIEKYIL